MAMHRHLMAMRETMARIATATTPEERRALLAEHQRQMVAAMRDMGMLRPDESLGMEEMLARMERCAGVMREMMGMMHQMMGQLERHRAEMHQGAAH
ncbi:MAG: hypothetical protein KatS3mg124_0666 [Porticoccaceae bacterium]|nr:MAG: hypothetical protein KatS3mg124_0666 [Porticoccaceae bacterium]